ncbi:50S ribosomal protein L23 [Patescibacteria group bacterium]|jgi:large subunit ribosomal protein L23|nr:50S ribosomal protein L23 [Patescibacteria group bacterium]
MAIFGGTKQQNATPAPRKKASVQKAGAVVAAASAQDATTKLHIQRKDATLALLQPLITEKASQLMGANQYLFRVHKAANKQMVKEAVEGLYKVKVKRVNMVRERAKTRHLGRQTGKTAAHKKAIISVAAGQHIDVM